MKKVFLKLNNGKVVLVISKELRDQLFDDGCITNNAGDSEYLAIVDLEIEQEPKIKAEKIANVEDWIQDWRELFPSGMNSNGYPYRGDRSACLAKMQKFVRRNDFSRADIFKATQIAINRSALQDYQYLPQAHYFIEKNGISKLKEVCNMVAEGVVRLDNGSSYEEKL